MTFFFKFTMQTLKLKMLQYFSYFINTKNCSIGPNIHILLNFQKDLLFWMNFLVPYVTLQQNHTYKKLTTCLAVVIWWPWETHLNLFVGANELQIYAPNYKNNRNVKDCFTLRALHHMSKSCSISLFPPLTYCKI